MLQKRKKTGLQTHSLIKYRLVWVCPCWRWAHRHWKSALIRFSLAAGLWAWLFSRVPSTCSPHTPPPLGKLLRSLALDFYLLADDNQFHLELYVPRMRPLLLPPHFSIGITHTCMSEEAHARFEWPCGVSLKVCWPYCSATNPANEGDGHSPQWLR